MAKAPKAPPPPKALHVWKTYLLYGALVSSIISSLLWLVALSANYWVLLKLPDGGVHRERDGAVLLKQYSGLWQMCRVERRNGSDATGQLHGFSVVPRL